MFCRKRKSQQEDPDRKLRSDLELEAAEQQENGISAEEARRYAAQRVLGNTPRVKVV